MSNALDHDEVLDRRLDWGLRETTGNEHAPDVTAAVLARAATGEAVETGDLDEGSGMRGSRTRPWLVAAMLLLGIGAVVAVSLAKREPVAPDPVAPVQEPEGDPSVRTVSSLEELLELPATATRVRLLRLPMTGEAFNALVRLRSLESLELLGVTGVEAGGLERLVELTKLQTLSLHDSFDERTRPAGRSRLEPLPRFPALRKLSVGSFIGSLGFDAIAACTQLEGLSLLSLHDVDPEQIAKLGALTELERLTLAGSSVEGPTLIPLQSLSNLWRLTLHGNRLTGADLPCWPQLMKIDLSDNPNLEAGVGEVLLRTCPTVDSVDLSGCPQVDDVTVAYLVDLPRLSTIDLSNCPSLTRQCLPLLAETRLLSRIGLDDNPWMTIDLADLLTRAGKKVRCRLKEGLTSADGLTAAKFNAAMEELERAHAAPPPEPPQEPKPPSRTVKIRKLEDFATLRDGVKFVWVIGSLSGRRPGLTLSDEAFAALAQVRSLEQLTFTGVSGVSAERIDALQSLPKLKCLSLEQVNTNDDSPAARSMLEPLPEFPALVNLNLRTPLTTGSLETIAKCERLKMLSLESEEQIPPTEIMKLVALPSLGSLSLTGAGITDHTLTALQSFPKLQSVGLSRGRFTSKGLQALSGMSELHSFTIIDGEIDPSALRHVPTSLVRLGLSSCRGLDASAGHLILERFPHLRFFDARSSEWVDDELLEFVLQLPKLESLGIDFCKSPTEKCLDSIIGCRSLQSVGAYSCSWLTDELVARLKRERPDLKIYR